MQKSGLLLVVSGVLIVIGLVLLVVGSQIILEEINQGSGTINSDKPLTILGEFESEKPSVGIFAIQVMEFKENTFSARILNPSDIQIMHQAIDRDTMEKQFDALDKGTYKLVIESTISDETQVFGAIGPLPNVGNKTALDATSMSILISGMIGLVLAGVVEIKHRRKSV